MEQRLQWIRHRPSSWLDWDPLRSGREARGAIQRRYPQSRLFVASAGVNAGRPAATPLAPAWWKPSRWLGGRNPLPTVGPEGVDLLWANMVLHNCAEPEGLIARWFSAVAVDGFLMFSCLGPDSLRELRELYAERGWPPAGHELTDMHDWGDMLVHAGFAEPVMDMERITLSYRDPARLLLELRQLGRNFHPARFAGLRGRGWQAGLLRQMHAALPREPGTGRLTVGFEVIYGHAFKPAPRLPVAAQTVVSVEEMRSALRRGRG